MDVGALICARRGFKPQTAWQAWQAGAYYSDGTRSPDRENTYAISLGNGNGNDFSGPSAAAGKGLEGLAAYEVRNTKYEVRSYGVRSTECWHIERKCEGGALT